LAKLRLKFFSPFKKQGLFFFAPCYAFIYAEI